MNVCVCGWYYNPDFMRLLRQVHKKHPVSVIGNQPWADRDGYPYNYHERENRGLEFGAYDYYLKTLWNGGDTLFMHDDMHIKPVIRGHNVVSPVVQFDDIAKFTDDVVFIFRNEQSRLRNVGIHGRVFFASDGFLTDLLQVNHGFDWDENNDGHIQGPAPDYCEQYNWAIQKLQHYIQVKKLTGLKVNTAYMPSIDYQRRGVG